MVSLSFTLVSNCIWLCNPFRIEFIKKIDYLEGTAVDLEVMRIMLSLLFLFMQ